MKLYKEIIKKTQSPKYIPIEYIPHAFVYAAKKGKEYYVLYILSNNFNELTCNDYNDAFVYACYNGNLSTVKMLLKKCSRDAIVQGYNWADCKSHLKVKKFLEKLI